MSHEYCVSGNYGTILEARHCPRTVPHVLVSSHNVAWFTDWYGGDWRYTANCDDIERWCTTFPLLVFYPSVKSLTSIAISQLIGVSENIISDCRVLVHTLVADWLVANPSPLGDTGSSSSWTKLSLGRRNATKALTRKDSGFLEVWTATLASFFYFPTRTTVETQLLSFLWSLAGFYLGLSCTLMSGEPTTT